MIIIQSARAGLDRKNNTWSQIIRWQVGVAGRDGKEKKKCMMIKFEDCKLRQGVAVDTYQNWRITKTDD